MLALPDDPPASWFGRFHDFIGNVAYVELFQHPQHSIFATLHAFWFRANNLAPGDPFTYRTIEGREVFERA